MIFELPGVISTIIFNHNLVAHLEKNNFLRNPEMIKVTQSWMEHKAGFK